MLKDKNSSAIAAVSDLDRARGFYEGVLGLTVVEEMTGVLTFKTGGTRLVVYQSEDLRPGAGNTIAWDGGEDVEAIAATLLGKGVMFEEYPEMGMKIDQGVHRDGDFRAIWFKDPDGNILHVNSM